MTIVKNLFTAIMVVCFSFTVLAAAGKPGKPGGVEADRTGPGGFEAAFKGALGDVKAPNLRAFYESEAGAKYRNGIDKVVKDLFDPKAQENIAANKEKFSQLFEYADRSAAKAKTYTSDLGPGKSYSGKAGEVIDGAATFVGVLRDLAMGGKDADLVMGEDVGKMFAELKKSDLASDTAAQLFIDKIVARLSANGRAVSWSEFLDKCAKALRGS